MTEEELFLLFLLKNLCTVEDCINEYLDEVQVMPIFLLHGLIWINQDIKGMHSSFISEL